MYRTRKKIALIFTNSIAIIMFLILTTALVPIKAEKGISFTKLLMKHFVKFNVDYHLKNRKETIN